MARKLMDNYSNYTVTTEKREEQGIHWIEEVPGLIVGRPDNKTYWFEISRRNVMFPAIDLHLCNSGRTVRPRELVYVSSTVDDCFVRATKIHRQ